MNDDGKTVDPERPADCKIIKVGIDGVAVEAMVQHEWNWLWVAGQWTSNVQCSTCLKIEPRGDSRDYGGTVSA